MEPLLQKWISTLVTLTILIAFTSHSDGKSAYEDLTLTRSEKEIFDKFKAIVMHKLDKDYQKQDIYLIRWLREKHFNMDEAVNMLFNDLKWREEQKMDTIDDEDWSEYEEDYLYFISGYDKEGRPTAVANFDEWDIRKGVLAGKRDKIVRWMTKGIQDVVKHIRELQAEGKNVTRWNFVINVKNFNFVQHACIPCLGVYLGFVSNWENHFPDSVDKLIIINAPAIFQAVLSVVKPLMSEDSKNALLVLGTNKEEWAPILFSFIDPSQLPIEYGGTGTQVLRYPNKYKKANKA